MRSPLQVEGETRAALNLYSPDQHGFSGATIDSAEAYAEQAQSRWAGPADGTLRDTRDDLSAAMRSRTAIDLATGAIMAPDRCGRMQRAGSCAAPP